MKTIEEKAKDFCRKRHCPDCGSRNTCDKEKEIGFCLPSFESYEAFLAGSAFAQEWISVEKELPESGITVLIKDKNGYVGLSCIRHGDWDYRFRNTITHWRPITRK